MKDDIFSRKRKRALREHKQSIVRTAKNGHRNKGRGLVLVKFAGRGVHLSYLTLEALKSQPQIAASDREEKMLIHEVSSYPPDSMIPVLVTDGITHRFSMGVRQ